MGAYTGRRLAHRPNEVIAALLIATLAIGPLISIPVSERQLELSPASVLGVLLAAHLFISASMQLRRTYHSPPKKAGSILLPASVLLVLPVFVATSFLSASAAYANFITGVVIAIFVARAWAQSDRKRIGPIDVGFVAFLVISCAQLLLQFIESESAAAFHAADVTNWGGSNYVGGVLVIVSFILLGRSRELTSASFWLSFMAAIGLVCAISTLSRSTIVALGAGAVALLWGAGQHPRARRNFRVAAVVSPIFTLIVYSAVNTTRFSESAAGGSPNIDARFSLFNMAWNEFLTSPIFGTGWTTLRDASAEQIGASNSFAHNFFLSFLQIGGLLALPLFIYVIATWLIAVSSGHPLSAAATASIALSMTEPSFEGLIGATISFATLQYISFTASQREPLTTSSVTLQHFGPYQTFHQMRSTHSKVKRSHVP